MSRDYRQRFLDEVSRFERCCDGAPRTEAGLRQFYERESRGIQPDQPDPYFMRLLDGKRWWEWQLNEIARTYLTSEWVGWAQYAEDYANDAAGLEQIIKRCKPAWA